MNTKTIKLNPTRYIKIALIIFNILFFYISISSAATLDTNLVANPSFENGITVPFNWDFVNNDGYVKWDSISNSGEKSIKIGIYGRTNEISGYPQSDLIIAEPLASYTFSAWGKTRRVGGTNAPAVRLVELDTNKNLIRQTNLGFSKGTNDWAQKSVDVKTDSNTAYFYVYANIWNGYGTFWVDDVELILKTEAPPTTDKPPSLSTSYSPSNPTTSDTITITTSALDDNGLAEINIYADSNLKKTCTVSGMSNSCSYASTYSAATHSYYAIAKDNAGKTTTSSMTQFSVMMDNLPSVSTSHSPSDPTTSETVTITASATDDIGLAEISIYADSTLKKTCTVSGTSNSCSCASTYSAATHSYYAIVKDNVGKTTTSSMNQFNVSSQLPYGGTAWEVPGIIQIEDFDMGGEGIAYHDFDIQNQRGEYRPDEGVDIELTNDSEGGYDIGWIKAGEWLEYSINITQSDKYDLEFRVARDGIGGTFHVEFNGVDKTGTLTIPDTGGWQSWTTVKKLGVSLSEGPQIMRIVMDSNSPTGEDSGNINYLRILETDNPPSVSTSHSPSSPTTSDTVIITASAIDDKGLAEINIYVDSMLKKTCSVSGPSNSCLYASTYSAATYSYYAMVKDNSGKTTTSSMKQFSVSSSFPLPTPTGSIYYVAKNGDDNNPGTEQLPWLTITKAANTLIAGDTVYIKEGIYNEQVIPQKSGTPGNYITYTSSPQDEVIIDGTGLLSECGELYPTVSWEGLIEIRGKSYINIIGLNIQKSSCIGIYVPKGPMGGVSSNYSKSSYINVENNSIYNTFSSAVLMQWGDHYIVRNNTIELGGNAGPTDSSEETISIQNNVDIFEVSYNTVFHSGFPLYGGEGIDAKWNVSNGNIFNNDIYDSQSVGIYVDSWTGAWKWGGDERGTGYANDINIYNNTIHNTTGSGIAISAELGGTVDRVDIYNNIVYDGCEYSIMIPAYAGDPAWVGYITDINVTNNVFHGNKGGALVGDYNYLTYLENINIINNIFDNNEWWSIRIDDDDYVGTYSVDYNLIYGFRNYANEIKGTNYIEADPQFVKSFGADFHLKSTSPAIDTGLSISAPYVDFDGIVRPSGAGYDIGAFEYAQ